MSKREAEDALRALASASKELEMAASPSERFADDRPDILIDIYEAQVRNCIAIGERLLTPAPKPKKVKK